MQFQSRQKEKSLLKLFSDQSFFLFSLNVNFQKCEAPKNVVLHQVLKSETSFIDCSCPSLFAE
jgi:hypothetical protein